MHSKREGRIMKLIETRTIRMSKPGKTAVAVFALVMGMFLAIVSAFSQVAQSANGDWQKRFPEIHWPAGHTPNDADLFAHNELFIKAQCSTVWQHIVEAPKWPEWYPNSHDVQIVNDKTGELRQGSRFKWNTLDIHIDSTVHEFVPYSRIGWFGKGKNIDAYHTWFLTSTPDGCQVVTEEVAKGPGAIAIRKSDPNAMHKGHDL
jgi:polyketide cyclase/dehydrase/lipid transport protein